MPNPISVSSATARRFMRAANSLNAPAADIATVLKHHGYIQIDPINVCGRMHDLILRNRVASYRENGLHDFVHSSSRPGYEHYLPAPANVLVAYPIEVWPLLVDRVHARKLHGGRYGRPLAPGHELLARDILQEIADRGPLTSDEIKHPGRFRSSWGAPGRLVRHLLEVLFVHGRVLISARRDFRRVYDLPHRVLPANILAARPAPQDETERWLVSHKLRQRRLVLLKKDEFSKVEDLVQQVNVPGCPPLACLRSDLPLFDLGVTSPGSFPASNRSTAPESRSLLLAPLDPLIYDRRVTAALWSFNYTWEAYTPPAKRQRGYYALPVLAGTKLVGHVDPKADRARRRLQVLGRSVRRGYRVSSSIVHLADFLGLES